MRVAEQLDVKIDGVARAASETFETAETVETV
jgi:hypothetical protein